MYLENMFSIEAVKDDLDSLVVKDVTLTLDPKTPEILTLKWVSQPQTDMIADSIVTLILQSQEDPNALTLTEPKECSHGHGHRGQQD